MKTDDNHEDGRQEAPKRAQKAPENRGPQRAAMRCRNAVPRPAEEENRSYRTYSAYPTYSADAPDFPNAPNRPQPPRISRHSTFHTPHSAFVTPPDPPLMPESTMFSHFTSPFPFP
jgi:hypothetical protein